VVTRSSEWHDVAMRQLAAHDQLTRCVDADPKNRLALSKVISVTASLCAPWLLRIMTR
jgi:hypothetical protein